jgi:uncharacterized repeat protein (TIGR01451 family)
MTTKLTMRAAIALIVASAAAAWCLATPSADIGSGSPPGPLTHVWIGNDLSCQVQHVADAPDYEFYGPDIIPGDSGTFIATGGVLYAPDFANHDYSSAEFFLGAYAPFTTIGQTGVTGAGSAVTPFKLVTTVGVGTTGLVIQQTDTYVTGREYYTTQITISNNGADTASGVLYRAADAFLGGSDIGYGFTQLFSGNRKSVGCSVNANNVPAGKIEEYIPLTGSNNFFEDEFSVVWNAIDSKISLVDSSASTTQLDNGLAISWDFSIPVGGSATYSHVTTFSPLGLEGLVTSKTADSPKSPVGTQNGYTITIENPNVNDVTVTSITDTLPAGFSYLGSTTGATSNAPAIAGQMLTWSGSFNVPGNGSITLHFLVTVANTPGDYFDEVGGSAEASYDVIGTGPTAKITVIEAPTPSPSPTATATATATAAATATPTPTPTPTATPMQFFTSFVIGDLDAVVGNHVTFWGSQWWKQNHLSGGGPTASFKGFANSLHPNPPICGGTWDWDSRPGNSSEPPQSIPADIIVMASSLITKAGPVISGDVPKMVIVHTDPGYGPAPGHDGTGTVTAVVCQH